MNEVFRNDKNTSDLINCIKNGDMIVFVGSGLSSGPGGYPSWWKLVAELLTTCDPECEKVVTNHTSADELQQFAQKAREKDRDKYISVLREEFAKKIITRRNYEFLIKSPFAGYVTTNFDPLLAFELNRNHPGKRFHSYPQLTPVCLNSGTVSYLHGYIAEGSIPDPDRIVLCKDDFEKAYTSGPLIRMWEDLLIFCPVLFLGCRLEEPQLDWVFNISNSVRRDYRERHSFEEPPRFIMLPERNTRISEDADPEHKEQLKRNESDMINRYKLFNISVVKYDPVDSSYSGLDDVIKGWSQLKAVNAGGFNPEGDIFDDR